MHPGFDAGRLILNPGKIVAKPRCIAVVQIGQPMPQETPVRRSVKASKSSTLSTISTTTPAAASPGVQTKRWLTAKQASERLFVSASTFERMIRKGTVPLYRVGPGGPRRFRIEDVDQAMFPGRSQEWRDELDAFINNQIKEG